MRRWLLWFLLVPQGFLVVGFLQDLGLPPLDMAVLSSLYLAWFAQRSSLLLLPLRSLFVAQRWLWQAVAAALLAIAVPKLAGLFGRVFDQPSVSAMLNGWQVVWSALLVPPLLSVLRFLPPFAAFTEPDGLGPHGHSSEFFARAGS